MEFYIILNYDRENSFVELSRGSASIGCMQYITIALVV